MCLGRRSLQLNTFLLTPGVEDLYKNIWKTRKSKKLSKNTELNKRVYNYKTLLKSEEEPCTK